MGDLKNPKLIWLKGFLFLVLGLTSAFYLLMYAPDLKVAVLLCLTVWSFCRCYYFVFYVIQHYVDPNYKFAGLTSFLRYVLFKNRLESEQTNVADRSAIRR